MTKIWLILLLVAALAAGGCASTDPGSREYIPGKGWTPLPN